MQNANYANMQISMMGYLSVNVLGHRNTLFCKVKVAWRFIHEQFGKILAKININEHILPIFLINFINLLAKTKKYKESFNNHFSKPYVRFGWNFRIKFSLPWSNFICL